MTINHVLVTRPTSQGAPLCAQLRKKGFTVTHVPVMEITALDSPEQMAAIQKVFSQVTRICGLVFVSVNAAEMALSWLQKFPPPRSAKRYAVGKTTATFLDERAKGDTRVIYPRNDMSSEGLLALPGLQAEEVRGKHFLIVRGEGGRELIAEELKARGAHVESVELYRRFLPMENAKALQQALPQADCVLVNSAESLENLLAMLNASADASPEAFSRGALFDKTIVVPGKRVADVATQAGFQHILIADNATDEAIVKVLVNS